MFKHLSSITHLQEIDMTTKRDGLDIIPLRSRACRWDLDSGLRQLSTLTRPRIVKFGSNVPDLKLKNLEWMIGHWPSLEEVSGHQVTGYQLQQVSRYYAD